MAAPERELVSRAVEQLADGFAGPLGDWLRDLCDGKSRLPALPPETMKTLLLAWLSPDVDSCAIVCRQCGLEYPHHQSPPLNQWKLLPGRRWGEGPPPWYDLPCFFTVCPGCGAAPLDMDWPTWSARRTARGWSWTAMWGRRTLRGSASGAV